MSRSHRRTTSASLLCLLLAACAALVAPLALADTALTGARKSEKPQRRAPAEGPAARRARALGLGDLKAAGKLLAGRTEASWVRAAGGDALPRILRLPVLKGYVTRGFGSGKGGYHQAVDIAGEAGLNVRAAAAGIVGYAGDQVSGYGNLVILVHPGGWVTTYAHNQKNLVVSGQKVSRGKVLGLLGSTGRSMGPHVHFELLVDGQNCDPMPLFRPAATRKNGAAAAPSLSMWKKPHKRPTTIRCAPRKHHPDYVNRAAPVDEATDEGGDPAEP